MRNSTKIVATRGRPRKFDEVAALEGAAQVFAEKGYSGTSLDELAKAMGMNRPSMYNAFGNKAAIYKRALQQYIDGIAGPLAMALKHDDLIQGLEDYFSMLVDNYVGELGGCLCTNTLPAEAANDEGFRTFYADVMQSIDLVLYERLTQGISAAENDEESLELQAKLLQALMQTLSLRVRAGAKRGELEALYSYGIRTIVAHTKS
ncbi:TetR/AcrR family transcriptional regulator [Bermanella sp. R86510]|uniref:TetR/AcrR family transcriptional regulator n=1 Tax=unclassified Bermanella TaxID=2627862 RepID=UPI0037C73FD4